MDPISKAHLVGTFNAIDRSKQYQGVTQEELVNQVNTAWAKIRVCEKSITSKDARILDLEQKIKRYRWANIALTSIITGLAWEGLKALVAYLPHLAK